MTDPLGDAGAMAQAQAKALVQNASALGLTWTVRPATIVSNSPVVALFDGDTEPIAMTSLMGPVYLDQRVQVFIVPPSANFIVGPLVPQQIGVRASITNAQAIPNAVQTSLAWNVIHEESGGDFIAAGGTSFRIPATGLWAISLRFGLAAFTFGGARNFLNFNMVTTIANQFPSNVRSSFVAGESTSSLSLAPVPLLAGDSFVASVYTEGGASSVGSALLSAYRVGGFNP